MFERFTAEARQAVVLAQEEVRRIGAESIEQIHLIVGLAGNGRTVAGRVLIGAGYGTALDVVGQSPSGHLPFSAASKRALELALREALQLGHTDIGTQHILLGIIREPDDTIPTDWDLDELRRSVIDLLVQAHKPDPREACEHGRYESHQVLCNPWA